jgi:hypothetical protein
MRSIRRTVLAHLGNDLDYPLIELDSTISNWLGSRIASYRITTLTGVTQTQRVLRPTQVRI